MLRKKVQQGRADGRRRGSLTTAVTKHEGLGGAEFVELLARIATAGFAGEGERVGGEVRPCTAFR